MEPEEYGQDEQLAPIVSTAELIDLVEAEGPGLSRSEQIAVECIENDEPFFVLRAKDIFSVMAVHNYAKLTEEFGPLDVEFHEAVTEAGKEMRRWQMANPERVKYPD